MQLIALGRRLFANTPIERLPLTSTIMRSVFKFGYGEDDVTVEFRGLQVTVPVHADDITLVPAIVGGFYEQIELDVFTELARLSKQIVDVGGNIGLFTVVGAAAMDDGRVVAFEPVPANVEYLRQNVAANGFEDRVEVIEMAVSDAPGTTSIYIASGIGTHSLSAANARSSKSLQVQLTTLDSWLGDRPVDLVKCDVEGFDAQVLRGADKLLRTHRPALFAEYTPHAIKQAGANPVDYLRQVFDIYDNVFLIDEPRASLQRITADQLTEIAERRGNYNLIAVSRPEHLRVVEDWLATRTSAKS